MGQQQTLGAKSQLPKCAEVCKRVLQYECVHIYAYMYMCECVFVCVLLSAGCLLATATASFQYWLLNVTVARIWGKQQVEDVARLPAAVAKQMLGQLIDCQMKIDCVISHNQISQYRKYLIE